MFGCGIAGGRTVGRSPPTKLLPMECGHHRWSEGGQGRREIHVCSKHSISRCLLFVIYDERLFSAFS